MTSCHSMGKLVSVFNVQKDEFTGYELPENHETIICINTSKIKNIFTFNKNCNPSIIFLSLPIETTKRITGIGANGHQQGYHRTEQKREQAGAVPALPDVCPGYVQHLSPFHE